MAPLDDTTPATRFDSFHVHRTSYKQIGEHNIEVGILVPKDIEPGKHPVIVKFHGGGLATGDCLYADWIAAFWVPFAHRTSSIIVLPNYRLIPEHTGSDILSDLFDFWSWFNTGGVDKFLSTTSHDKLDLDYDKVLVAGDSAGGYMAFMSALLHPQPGVKAILAQYPMTNYLRIEPSDTFFGAPSPGPEVLDQHLASITPGVVVSSAVPPERAGLSYCLAAYDKYLTYFGTEKDMWPIERIEKAETMPPTWIIHGGSDSAVSVEDSQLFVKKWTEKEVRGEVKLSVLPGMEHGFDIATKESEEGWLREGLEWVEGQWLK